MTDDLPWIWSLFICGGTPASTATLRRLRHLCDHDLSPRVKLRVVDVHSDPELALRAGVRAIPCLVPDPLAPSDPSFPAVPSSSEGLLRQQLQYLQQEYRAQEALLEVITSGQADALVVSGNVYLQDSSNTSYRHLVQQMGEAVATLSSTGVVLYANPRLAELLDQPRDVLLGRPLGDYLSQEQAVIFDRLRMVCPGRIERAELELVGRDGTVNPVLATISGLITDGAATHSLVLTHLGGLQPRRMAQAIDTDLGYLLAEIAGAFMIGVAEIPQVTPSRPVALTA